MEMKRASGILLHPTSLPGPFGLGTLGAEAEEFVDFLARSRQSVWQILPLTPTGYGNSPYSAFSAFAGNPLLICPRKLAEHGDLDGRDLAIFEQPEGRADYGAAYRRYRRLLPRAAERFFAGGSSSRLASFREFCVQQAYWLNDYALFQALRRRFDGASWTEWPDDVRARRKDALRRWGEELAEEVAIEKYAQFAFFEQWFAVKEYANDQGIRILGDMPIFVALDSADVWANSGLFKLDAAQRPTVVAGVPPDYFSATGQRWGNPLYRWEKMAENGFSWWLSRMRWALAQTDMVRIDHFRGFEACWEVPAEEETAVNGTWQPVPGDALLRRFAEVFGDIPVVAEDLGLITPEVEDLRDHFALPGMKVLQFAFGSGPANPYLPHNLPRHSVIYTGTHDNDTTLGWWQALPEDEKTAVCRYLGHDRPDMPWDLVRTALAAVADLAVLPLQDILALDSGARMNCPGQEGGNWSWRLAKGQLTDEHAARLADLTHIYGRRP